jgi:probable HAF family extracellular repeat protein
MIDLGTNLGASDSSGLAIDQRGEVLMTSGGDSFLWQKGFLTSLGGTVRSFPPVAMNQNGRIVGRASTTVRNVAVWDAANPSQPHSVYLAPNNDEVYLAGVGADDEPFGEARVQLGCAFCIHGLVWPANLSVYTDLDTGQGTNGPASSVVAINALGQATGTTGNYPGQAALWVGATKQLIGSLGNGNATPVGINDATQIAGNNVAADGTKHAFFWQAGAMQDLGTLLGGSSQAVAINNSGQVVGNSDGHAFLWSAGTMLDLGTLGGATSSAVAINDAGQVAGNSQTASGATHAFLWHGGTMTDLGTLGGPTSTAAGINASGRVAGTSVTIAGMTHAFVACPADSSTGYP